MFPKSKSQNPMLVEDIELCITFSSIGMAKAALETVNGMNMFGTHGSSWSVIYTDIDAHYRNRINFITCLPRESASKVAPPLLRRLLKV